MYRIVPYGTVYVCRFDKQNSIIIPQALWCKIKTIQHGKPRSKKRMECFRKPQFKTQEHPSYFWPFSRIHNIISKCLNIQLQRQEILQDLKILIQKGKMISILEESTTILQKKIFDGKIESSSFVSWNKRRPMNCKQLIKSI